MYEIISADWSCFVVLHQHLRKFYETLDGRVLVPYQCVVSRQEWEKLRDVFAPAFGKLKAAYRRANGGNLAYKNCVSWRRWFGFGIPA